MTARRARAADAHTRAKKALRDVVASQEPVTFTAVSARAGVSREYLYRTPDLLTPSALPAAPTPVHSAPDKATGEQPIVAALRDHIRRLQVDHRAQLTTLRAENIDLRRQMETALGRLLARDPAHCNGR